MHLELEKPTFTEENFVALLNLNSELSEKLESLSKENEELQQNQKALENQIACYVEQIRLGKIKQFGQKSETSGQLELLLSAAFDETGEIGQAEDKDETKADENLTDTETITYTRKKKGIGRRIDTSKLPREVIIHDLSKAEKSCSKCGSQLEKFGEDRSEQLEYIPAQVKVIEHVVPKYKYSCNCCDTVKSAAKPNLPLPKSMASPSLITEIIIKKFEHHLPWYRQSKIFSQDGLDIPANTISNWFMQAGEVLEPLSTALKKQINNTNILQVDETPVQVLKNNVNGYMWGYHSLKPKNRFILFEYNESRGGKIPNDSLDKYQGILQTDGYSGYNNLRARDNIIAIGCWAHCRRYFTDVVKISNKSGKAHEIVKWIGKLYQIEAEAREQNLTFESRKDLRQSQAPPILKKIREKITKATPLPKSALGKAITYALNHWEYLTRYVDNGEAEIDNNLIENQIRPFALGRRNWLFLGNEKSAKRASFFYSIIQTCRINNIDPRKYLIYVLSKATEIRRGEINPTNLLPQFIDKDLLS